MEAQERLAHEHHHLFITDGLARCSYLLGRPSGAGMQRDFAFVIDGIFLMLQYHFRAFDAPLLMRLIKFQGTEAFICRASKQHFL